MQDEINDLKEEIKKLKSQLQSNQGYFKDPAQKDLFDSGEYHLPSAPVPGAYMTQIRKLRKWEKQKKNEQYLRRRYPIVEEAYQKLQFAKRLCSD
mgnify:CR=1 FL=1|jgi:hypothetical protein